MERVDWLTSIPRSDQSPRWPRPRRLSLVEAIEPSRGRRELSSKTVTVFWFRRCVATHQWQRRSASPIVTVVRYLLPSSSVIVVARSMHQSPYVSPTRGYYGRDVMMEYIQSCAKCKCETYPSECNISKCNASKCNVSVWIYDIYLSVRYLSLTYLRVTFLSKCKISKCNIEL